MRILQTSIVLAFVLTISVSLFWITTVEFQIRELKSDFVEVSKAKYGMFNVDRWKVIVTEIVQSKIEEFQLTEENKEVLRDKISVFLHEAINNYEEDFYEAESQKFFSGKALFAGITNGFGRLRKDIPRMTESIIYQMEEPETRERLKLFSEEMINQYADNTFSDVDYTVLDRILAKYEIMEIDEAKTTINELQINANDSIALFKWIIYGLIAALFVWLLLYNGFSSFDLKAICLLAAFVLFAALLLPMIDIDARVSEFKFHVLGEPVSFSDQVIYFKSKSILEVVWLMISQGKIDILIVGFLVLTFSVLFPVTKLILTFAASGKQEILENKLVKFFVLKSGKWSMADVMVVAIFMSYIGFSSILTEQLRQLENLGQKLEILTTNQSLLNTGFFLFTLFVMLSIGISNRIQTIQL